MLFKERYSMIRSSMRKVVLFVIMLCGVSLSQAQQHSRAREWNEILLTAIRDDFARPTVHARNLFHASVIMYDSWAFFQEEQPTYFLGRTLHDYSTDLPESPVMNSGKAEIQEVMSVAMYRLLEHRFRNSPAYPSLIRTMRDQMTLWGYEDYFLNPPNALAQLGEYLGVQVIEFGLQDGANEEINYGNYFYETVNEALDPTQPGNPNLSDPDRWQSLNLGTFIDQSSNLINGAIDFLSPEWGFVAPFAMTEEDRTVGFRDRDMFVYHDPGAPPYLSDEDETLYKWGFELVSIWGAHLDPADEVMWDISPASIGNIPALPSTFKDMEDFYQLIEGGDASSGWDSNPFTEEPYEPQIVPRADYARVLAEFWADGPDSETPPGHWFTILNYVNDHPQFEKKYKGEGEVLDDLEWDVKAYFSLGGAMHDAAISAWSLKGYYDYIRPISAIRYMADQGQSSNTEGPSYHPDGIRLYERYIEVVVDGDPLAGANGENIGKIKLYSWRGPDYIDNPETDLAGVGWILAENWWPYQRPTFVTPPFAGYVSGHSTFSRAAAEVMTMLTGDPFFPGGLGEFVAEKDEFLVFEEGPSQDIVLQWATYRDASDQTSLSRIWGGIHPPADDIPGRLIGIEVGIDAFNAAERVFNNELVTATDALAAKLRVFPNPVASGGKMYLANNLAAQKLIVSFIDLQGRTISVKEVKRQTDDGLFKLSVPSVKEGLYLMLIDVNGQQVVRRIRIAD